MEERLASLLDFAAQTLIEDVFVTHPQLSVNDERKVVEEIEILLAKYDLYRELVTRVKIRLDVK